MEAGLDNVLRLCKSAGIRSALRPYPATFLGSSEVTLSELALGYTIFPNGGWRPNAMHILERIEEKDGTVVWDAQRQKTREPVIKPETAYEVHSCLEDALEVGTGKTSHTEFGLKKIPGAAGKTGTAYDFTDALFVGYDSALTCGVWAGFDKPQKIYRGAFGRELALPVWVDIMNASAERYKAKELAPPASLKKVEICSRSGLLATDKCYDSVKGPNGESVQRRTTYMEIGTQAQVPTEPCNVHGEPRARILTQSGESEFPRAAPAVDLSDVQPVFVKGLALIADKDPYNSVRPIMKATPVPTPSPEGESADAAGERKTGNPTPETGAPVMKALPAKPTPETGAPVMKAIPVQPQDKQPLEIRKAEPVGPLDEVKDRTLLKSATPPPTDDPNE